MSERLNTRAHYIGAIRAAADCWQLEHPDQPAIEVMPTHIDAQGFANGIAYHEDAVVIAALEFYAEQYELHHA